MIHSVRLGVHTARVTMYLADVTRWQPADLDLRAVKAAGFDAVNIQTSGRDGWRATPRWVADRVDRALAAGLGVCLYHWLDSLVAGQFAAEQFLAVAEATAPGVRFAHQVDCEDTAHPATEAVWREYVATVQQRLGRHVLNYSGDWWWSAPGRGGWRGADLTPYLMGPPNDGYLPAYPGDDSLHWLAGWGGWPMFAALQYRVGSPAAGLPTLSLAAIRDPAVWTALTGEVTPVATYADWVNAGRPYSGIIRPLARLAARLRAYGYTVYGIGNQEHLEHQPPEDHTPFSATGYPVASPLWWVHAIDVMPPPAGSGLPSLQQLGAQLLADRKAGVFPVLKYMNWEPDGDYAGDCYQERFMPSYVRRSSTDRGHIHLSGYSNQVADVRGDTYDPVARLRAGTVGEDDVSERLEWFAHGCELMIPYHAAGPLGPGTPAGGPTGRQIGIVAAALDVQAQVRASRVAVEAVLALVQAGGGDVETGAVLAKMDELADADKARDEQRAAQIAALQADLDSTQAALAEARRRLADAVAEPGPIPEVPGPQ